MPWGVAAAAVATAGTIYAASQQSSAAENAANKQYQATTQGQDLMREMYARNAPYWTPYVNLGQKGATTISQMMPYLTKQFTPSDLQANLAPNYQFTLGQGLQATRQAQNVGGGGSNITRAADLFAQNYAQNAYQQAFNNFQTGRSNIYNTLQSISQLGETGAAGLSNLGTGTATNVANLGIQGATALGAGQIGSANAWASGVTGAANTLGNAGMYYGLTNRSTSQPAAGGNVPGGTASEQWGSAWDQAFASPA